MVFIFIIIVKELVS